jgi:hypothetical protein
MFDLDKNIIKLNLESILYNLRNDIIITKYETYFIVMIELLFNHNSKIDLGNYVLESTYDFGGINSDNWNLTDLGSGLGIAVRLKNKRTGIVECGEFYYKFLTSEDYRAVKIHEHTIESEVIAKKIMKKLMDCTFEEKMDFILRPEFYSKFSFSKLPYCYGTIPTEKLSKFLKELTDYGNYPMGLADGPMPEDAEYCINAIYANYYQQYYEYYNQNKLSRKF